MSDQISNSKINLKEFKSVKSATKTRQLVYNYSNSRFEIYATFSTVLH